MRIASLHLDDMVTVPGGKLMGEGLIGDLRESTFRSADGWDIRETLPGVFSLSSEWAPEPVTIGGYGYSYVRERVEPVDTESPAAVAATREQISVVVPHGKRGRR